MDLLSGLPCYRLGCLIVCPLKTTGDAATPKKTQHDDDGVPRREGGKTGPARGRSDQPGANGKRRGVRQGTAGRGDQRWLQVQSCGADQEGWQARAGDLRQVREHLGAVPVHGRHLHRLELHITKVFDPRQDRRRCQGRYRELVERERRGPREGPAVNQVLLRPPLVRLTRAGL